MAKTCGWWNINYTVEPNEIDLQQIAKLVRDGFTSGEIVEDEEEDNSYNVYYAKDIFMNPRDIDIKNINNTHVAIEVVSEENKEDIFIKFQGSGWFHTPSKVNGYIKDLGLNHTSMSINDIIICLNDSKIYRVVAFGFEFLGLTDW